MASRSQRRDKQPADPTPEQIRARCLAIQAGWSDLERQRRAVQCQLNKTQLQARPGWLPPLFSQAMLDLEHSDRPSC